MDTLVIEHLLSVVSGWDSEAGIATTSWAVPSGATPHHGAQRGRRPEESHTDRAGGQPHRERPRRAPGPSLAGQRSWRNRL